MIRQPSPMMRLLKWHRDALRDPKHPRHDGIPEAGWYKMRLVKNGPWVPVYIYVERDIDPETGELLGPERIVADCDGKRRDAAALWTYVTPISRNEYMSLVHRATSEPLMADRMSAVDLATTPMRPF